MTCDICKNRNRAFDCSVLKYDADNHCFEECPEYEEVKRHQPSKAIIDKNKQHNVGSGAQSPNIDTRALMLLKSKKPRLSKQQYKTLRGQVLAGDSDGAMKGLKNILQRRIGG